jgi:hypothetical protein
MRWFNRYFQKISGFGRNVALACLEYFDVASLHLLAIHLDRAQSHHDALSAGSRSRRAWRAIFEHAKEIVFEQGARWNGLKKKQGREGQFHFLCAFQNRVRVATRSVQQRSF